MRLEGARGLERQLNKLPQKILRRVLRGACRQAMKPVLADAKANAPKMTGQLEQSLRIRTALSTKRGTMTARVQTREGDYKGDQFYAAFHEYGTSRQPARPFMRPAFDRHAASIPRVWMDHARAGIIREAMRK